MLKLKIIGKVEKKDEYLNRRFIGNGGTDPNDTYKIISYDPYTKRYLRTEKGEQSIFTGITYSKKNIEKNIKEGSWVFLD